MRIARVAFVVAVSAAISRAAWGQIAGIPESQPPHVARKTADPAPHYGLDDLTALNLYAWEFQPLDDRIVTGPTAPGSFLKYVVSSSAPFGGGYLEAPVHLPNGASIESFAWVGCHNGGASGAVLYYTDSPDGASIVVASASSISSQCGISFAAFSPHTVQNNGRSYAVEVNLPVGDSNTSLRAVAIYYRLQVSPAPQEATFADVPPSDGAFQFVEALAASGVTAGCGGDNFCPDAPLTRRQMAVFLAKALGLHWPF